MTSTWARRHMVVWARFVLSGLLAASIAACVRPTASTRDEQTNSVRTAVNTCVLGQECCPAGYTQVTLTENPDNFATNATNQCIVALGGSDVLSITGGNDVVLAGEG